MIIQIPEWCGGEGVGGLWLRGFRAKGYASTRSSHRCRRPPYSLRRPIPKTTFQGAFATAQSTHFPHSLFLKSSHFCLWTPPFHSISSSLSHLRTCSCCIFVALNTPSPPSIVVLCSAQLKSPENSKCVYIYVNHQLKIAYVTSWIFVQHLQVFDLNPFNSIENLVV